MNWREPKTKAFSCVANPGDFSCDNGVLFTAEAYRLGLISLGEAEEIVLKYEMAPGLLSRYPGTNDPMSYDDHLGAASISPMLARRIHAYMSENDWTLPNKNYLGRFPILEPVVRAGAGLPLSNLNIAKASAAYMWNLFEPAQDTSGKLMLWLCADVLRGASPHLAAAISVWDLSLSLKYPNKIAGAFQIYFPEGHPFREIKTLR